MKLMKELGLEDWCGEVRPETSRDLRHARQVDTTHTLVGRGRDTKMRWARLLERVLFLEEGEGVLSLYYVFFKSLKRNQRLDWERYERWSTYKGSLGDAMTHSRDECGLRGEAGWLEVGRLDEDVAGPLQDVACGDASSGPWRRWFQTEAIYIYI